MIKRNLMKNSLSNTEVNVPNDMMIIFQASGLEDLKKIIL